MADKQLPEPGWYKRESMPAAKTEPAHTQVFLVTVTSDKPVADLAQKITQRLWTAEGHVTNVEAKEVRFVGGVVSEDNAMAAVEYVTQDVMDWAREEAAKGQG